MGTLNLIRGDLFTTEHELLVHAVNAAGAFNAGVAKQVRKRYPEAYRAYMRRYNDTRQGGGWKLGEVQVVQCDQYRRWVANICTQEAYGRQGKVYADLDAIVFALGRVLDIAQAQGWGVAMPRIGCGLGGLKWGDVLPALTRIVAESDVAVSVYSLED